MYFIEVIVPVSNNMYAVFSVVLVNCYRINLIEKLFISEFFDNIFSGKLIPPVDILLVQL